MVPLPQLQYLPRLLFKFAFLSRFPELFKLLIAQLSQYLSLIFHILWCIFLGIVQYFFKECMKYPPDAWPRSLSERENLCPVDREHADRNRIAQCFVHHRHVLAQTKRLLFGPPRPYAIVHPQLQKLFDVILPYTLDRTAHCCESYRIGIGEKHVPTHEIAYVLDSFT